MLLSNDTMVAIIMSTCDNLVDKIATNWALLPVEVNYTSCCDGHTHKTHTHTHTKQERDREI